MGPGTLSENLLTFIQRCVPSYQAAEMLLIVAAMPKRLLSAEEIVESMHPALVTPTFVKDCAEMFVASGLLSSCEGKYRFTPASSALERSVDELAEAYNAHPVSLITAIAAAHPVTSQSR